ncbi:MAG: large subunit ribosomal protein L19 [Parcubacteria group bacterium Licking1014_1]|nr:MAG: large subunit ribosomal protein L19 [Parcubacteria group bacterium Licking1014_1]
MSKLLDQFNQSQLKKDLPDIKSGDTVRVRQKIKEKDKERIQIFEGIVIAKKHGKGVSSAITVRKVVEGIGVERIFPIHSSLIAKIEVVKHGKTRRAKLYYLRATKGKKSKLKIKDFTAAIAEEEPMPEELPSEIVKTEETSS